MIRAIRCDQLTFRSVTFKPGFNVVLADRTKEATRRDSRNGLGKSTLVEVIHFGLGSEPRRGDGLLADPLQGWTFELDLQLNGSSAFVSRSTSSPKLVALAGDFTSRRAPSRQTSKSAESRLPTREWVSLLGRAMFGLPEGGYDRPYAPTFRSLVSYFARRGRDAFSSPFEHHRKQAEWDKQVNNAYLLSLAWEDASDWQRLKEEKGHLDSLRKASKSGVFKEVFGSVGELEAEKIRLEAVVEQHRRGLATFNVHPQYREVEAEATRLTEEIQKLANDRISKVRQLAHYEQSLSEEREPAADSLVKVYAEAGVTMPSAVVRRLEEVQTFHLTVIQNRREFLAQEIDSLRREVVAIDERTRTKTEQRAELMKVLQAHGPWDEYAQLQQRQTEAVTRLRSLEEQIDRLRRFEEGRSALRIQTETLRARARRDYAERAPQRQRAVQIFNENSERLYEAPGNLVIDVSDAGYKFNVDIQRSGSGGVGNMKVFCYDLTLAELWTNRAQSPGFLVHDSMLFDGVDERQVANALVLAAEKSQKCGFQYICMINSDAVPWKELEGVLDLRQYVRLTLTDESEAGSLLGIRY